MEKTLAAQVLRATLDSTIAMIPKGTMVSKVGYHLIRVKNTQIQTAPFSRIALTWVSLALDLSFYF